MKIGDVVLVINNPWGAYPQLIGLTGKILSKGLISDWLVVFGTHYKGLHNNAGSLPQATGLWIEQEDLVLAKNHYLKRYAQLSNQL